jgi:hypothetical protein
MKTEPLIADELQNIFKEILHGRDGNSEEWEIVPLVEGRDVAKMYSRMETALNTSGTPSGKKKMLAILKEIMDGKDGCSDNWSLVTHHPDLRPGEMYERIRKVIAEASPKCSKSKGTSRMKKSKLLPCPVCGEKPAIDRNPAHYSVCCNGYEHCLATEARKTEKEAIAVWNRLVRHRSNTILVHYDIRRDGSTFESFYRLEVAHKAIAKYIKDHGGEKVWEQRNELVWEHGNGEDFINIAHLIVKE